jgi:chromosome segregation ATPase
VHANAAKARADLAAHVATKEKTPEVETRAAELARQIDEAEARKVSNLEKEMTHADEELDKLTNALVKARASLAAYDAKHKQ